MKYQKFTPSDCKDIEIKKFEFVPKTQFHGEFTGVAEMSAAGLYLNHQFKSFLRWNLKNFSSGLYLPNPGLN